MHVSLLWRVARYTSGEAVANRLARRRQATVEAPPQSLIRLTLRKRRETCASGGKHDERRETSWRLPLRRGKLHRNGHLERASFSKLTLQLNGASHQSRQIFDDGQS